MEKKGTSEEFVCDSITTGLWFACTCHSLSKKCLKAKMLLDRERTKVNGSDIEKLANSTVDHVDFSQFSIHCMDYVNMIWSLPNIRYLNVSESHLVALPKTIETNTSITVLNLSNNVLTNRDACCLARNTTLKSLQLRYNYIHRKGFKCLAENSTLDHLDLSHNNVGNLLPVELDEDDPLTVGVESLHVRNCSLSTRDIGDISKGSRLAALDVSCNNLTSESINMLLLSTVLKMLYMNANYFGSDVELRQLATNTTLTHLEIRECSPSEKAILNIAANTAIRALDLSCNPLSGNMCSRLFSNDTIKQLTMRDCGLVDDHMEGLECNESITDLNLRENHRLGNGALRTIARNNTIMHLEIYTIRDCDYEKAMRILSTNTTITALDIEHVHAAKEVYSAFATRNRLEMERRSNEHARMVSLMMNFYYKRMKRCI